MRLVLGGGRGGNNLLITNPKSEGITKYSGTKHSSNINAPTNAYGYGYHQGPKPISVLSVNPSLHFYQNRDHMNRAVDYPFSPFMFTPLSQFPGKQQGCRVNIFLVSKIFIFV